jgi:nicotinamidase/pyrazinamidase
MKALIVVDMQNDFMPGGALPVPGGDIIVPLINQLTQLFPLCIATQDWHPPDHMSFAVNHPGKKIGEHIIVGDLSQMLWPVHCVQNTHGAEFASGLDLSHFAAIFHKGVDPQVDSYSTFFDNARRKETGLADYLRRAKVTELYFAGVAVDYCVLYSVLDALDLGFITYIIMDACRGINLRKGDIEKSYRAMAASGAKLITFRDAVNIFQPQPGQA